MSAARGAGLGARFERASAAGFGRPHDLVLGPMGLRLYVAGLAEDRVAVLDPSSLRLLGSVGEDKLSRPPDVAFDRGRVYAAAPGNDRIQVLSRHLAPLFALGGAGYDFDEPKDVDIDPRGWLTVADEYNHQIKLLDPERRIALTIGTGEAGAGPNRFNYPEGVELSGENLWVSDTRNHRIVRYLVTGPPSGGEIKGCGCRRIKRIPTGDGG